MTLNQLRYFCTAARYHSISQAARSLFVTQPTISIAIRDLEKEFSLSLFNYTKNRLELTPDGERFFEKASYILRCSDELKGEFVEAGRYTSKVRIGIPPMLSMVFFPELLDAFHEKHPNVFLELEEYGSVRACNLVQDEVLDVALVNMEIPTIDKFQNMVLLKDQVLYCVSPDHPLADRTSLTGQELSNENLILFNGDSVLNQLMNLQLDAQKKAPRVILRCSQIPTTLKFVRRGDCGCFLYSSMLPQIPEVRGIPLEPSMDIKIGVVWKKGRYVTKEVQNFLDFCQSYYKDGHP